MGIPKEGIPEQGIPPVERIPVIPKVITKRGTDIKSFADLPPDVQHSINKMSKAGGMINGKIDQAIKANRTAIAITYQRAFGEDICFL